MSKEYRFEQHSFYGDDYKVLNREFNEMTQQGFSMFKAFDPFIIGDYNKKVRIEIIWERELKTK